MGVFRAAAKAASSFVQEGRFKKSVPEEGVHEHAPAPETRSADATTPWRFRRGRRGTVRDLQVRQDEPDEVLSFRLEIHDRDGNVLRRVPVELRKRRIRG